MKPAFFMDVHVPRAVTVALRLRGIDVLTAQEDGSAELEDGPLLRRATGLNRILAWCRRTKICYARAAAYWTLTDHLRHCICAPQFA